MLARLALCLIVAAFAALALQNEAQAQSGYEAELEAAINYYFGGDPDAHYIVECESGYGADLYNEWSGTIGPWQFMPSTAAGLGYDPMAMYDPWASTEAAYHLYQLEGWSPWECAY